MGFLERSPYIQVTEQTWQHKPCFSFFETVLNHWCTSRPLQQLFMISWTSLSSYEIWTIAASLTEIVSFGPAPKFFWLKSLFHTHWYFEIVSLGPAPKFFDWILRFIVIDTFLDHFNCFLQPLQGKEEISCSALIWYWYCRLKLCHWTFWSEDLKGDFSHK